MTRRATSPPLFGLAPDEVYRAVFVTEDAVSSYLAVSPFPAANRMATGGLFSVALAVGSPPLGVTQHPALWSSDFPQDSAGAKHRSRPALTRTTPVHDQEDSSSQAMIAPQLSQIMTSSERLTMVLICAGNCR